MTSGRSRARSAGMGWTLRITLVAAGAAVVCVVFALGVAAGRQWTRPAADVATEPARKGAPARRSGLVDADGERPRAAAEKLTFYQTLTAPLGPTPSYTRPLVASRPAPHAQAGRAGAAEPVPGREPAASRDPASPSGPTAPRAPAPPGRTDAAPPEPARRAPASFSVQVGAFKSRQQADAVHRDLRLAGFEAFVSTLGTTDGDTRFRVRVGPFASRAEAERTAERMRATRALPTYVAGD